MYWRTRIRSSSASTSAMSSAVRSGMARKRDEPKGKAQRALTPEARKKQMNKPKVLTTDSGAPVTDNQNTRSAGPGGPLLLEDHYMIEKLAHFERERIPERVV